MNRLKKITVVTVSDNHYLILLAALVKSIEVNLNGDTGLDMWVVDDGLSKDSIMKLERTIDPLITQLCWKKVKEIIPPGTKLPLDYNSWPLNIYMRLFVPGLMPPGTEKIIFLDVDIINCKDLYDLWQTGLQGNIIAAVQDSRIKTFDNPWGGVKNYEALGMCGDTQYFNSGVLLIDIDNWKRNNITQQTLDTISRNNKHANYPDQYGLNIVLANKWLALEPGWNHFASKNFEACYNIHFIQRKPIYKSYDNDRGYQDLFYHYLDQTEWKGTKAVSESKRYLKKISNILEKVMNRVI